MRLPDKWYQKYKKDQAFHKAGYNRNKVDKALTKYSRWFLQIAALTVTTLSIYWLMRG